MKKNSKKIAALALVGLVSVSAYAWLNTSEVQSGTNMIKPGQISIKFDNELAAIALVAPDSIPMTHDYAKGNLTAYTFDIVNDGDVNLDYSIYADSISGTFDTSKIDIMLKDGAGEMTYIGTLDQFNVDSEGKIAMVSKVNMAPNETHSYELIAHVDDSVVLADYTGKDISFGLKVEAVQHDNTSVTYADYYKNNNGIVTKNTYIKWVEENNLTELDSVAPYYGDVYKYTSNDDTYLYEWSEMYKMTLDDGSAVYALRDMGIGSSTNGKTVIDVELVSGIKVQ